MSLNFCILGSMKGKGREKGRGKGREGGEGRERGRGKGTKGETMAAAGENFVNYRGEIDFYKAEI